MLTCEISPDLVDEVIELAGCREKRRRLPPARAVVYFVLGLCLFSGADSSAPPGYRSVMPWLTNRLWLWGLAAATGADLAWRIKKNQVLTPVKVLPDGWSCPPRPRTSGTAMPAPPAGSWQSHPRATSCGPSSTPSPSKTPPVA
ncbi:MAG: transposase domain-containing protein [Micromonosporaceae bacterium]